MMRPTRVFEREHRFYAELAAESPVRTPDTYHIVCDVGGGNGGNPDGVFDFTSDDDVHLLGQITASVFVDGWLGEEES